MVIKAIFRMKQGTMGDVLQNINPVLFHFISRSHALRGNAAPGALRLNRAGYAWFSSYARGRIDVMKSPGCPTENFEHDIFLS